MVDSAGTANRRYAVADDTGDLFDKSAGRGRRDREELRQVLLKFEGERRRTEAETKTTQKANRGSMNLIPYVTQRLFLRQISYLRYRISSLDTSIRNSPAISRANARRRQGCP